MDFHIQLFYYFICWFNTNVQYFPGSAHTITTKLFLLFYTQTVYINVTLAEDEGLFVRKSLFTRFTLVLHTSSETLNLHCQEASVQDLVEASTQGHPEAVLSYTHLPLFTHHHSLRETVRCLGGVV